MNKVLKKDEKENIVLETIKYSGIELFKTVFKI